MPELESDTCAATTVNFSIFLDLDYCVASWTEVQALGTFMDKLFLALGPTTITPRSMPLEKISKQVLTPYQIYIFLLYSAEFITFEASCSAVHTCIYSQENELINKYLHFIKQYALLYFRLQKLSSLHEPLSFHLQSGLVRWCNWRLYGIQRQFGDILV